MNTSYDRNIRFLQTIKTAAELLFDAVPYSKRKALKKYLELIDDRVAVVALNIQTDMFDKNM